MGLVIGNKIGLRRFRKGTLSNPPVSHPPSVSLPVSSDILDVSAIVGATLNCNGLETTWSIEYGATAAYGSTQVGGVTSANGAKTVQLTGLTQNSTYHWRFKAVNADGTSYSADQVLTTVNTELITYTANLVTPISDAYKEVVNTTISRLKVDYGVTSLSEAEDVIYLLGGETEEISLRNLVKDAHHATLVGSPVFTPFKGFTGSTNNYINTNYTPSTDGVRYTLNNGSHGDFANTAITEAAYGVRDTQIGALYHFNTGTSSYPNHVNTAGSGGAITGFPLLGNFDFVRNNSANEQQYVNGVYVRGTVVASSFRPNLKVYLLCRNNQGVAGNFTTAQLAFWHIGKDFTATQIADKNTTINLHIAAAEQLIPKVVSNNPYSAVNFATVNKYKTSMHMHTNLSDGTNTPTQMIEAYAAKNFDIISITDHDFNGDGITPTWPWSTVTAFTPIAFAGEVAELYNVNGRNMLAVQGNELSNGHHRQSLLNNLWQIKLIIMQIIVQIITHQIVRFIIRQMVHRT